MQIDWSEDKNDSLKINNYTYFVPSVDGEEKDFFRNDFPGQPIFKVIA